ncbi:MAG: helix-turn-helix domain-containing protein [Proteobacteria bacterium]|nr:helix-turn-helix domain-containing protein [Pseudomonadota bacterium]
MAETNDDVVIVENSSTVGQQLKQAREAKKITIAEVAAQLRLTKDFISYLETNQWDKLHGRAYARGYFSSYVSFLSLPQDELLAAFNLEYKVSEPEVHTHQLTLQKKSRLAPFLLILTVLILTWFAYQQWQITAIEESNETEVEIANDHESEDAFSSSVVEPLAVAENERVVIENGESLTEIEQVVEEELTTIDDKTVDNVEDVVVVPESQAEIIDDAVVNDTVAENVIIELHFSEDSWVEVVDADGQVLIKKIGKADKKIVLSGRPPLTVLLGHASAVTVKYNDEDIDTAQYTKSDVARFSLGVEL